MNKQGHKAVVFAFVFALMVTTLMFIGMNNVSAADYLPHKQNTAFDLIISSNNASSCNLTYIQYTNYPKALFNVALTKSGSDFYTTIASGNYSNLGSVCHGVRCTDGNSFQTGSVCREITATGISYSESRTNAISRSIYVVFGVAVILFLTFLFYQTSIPVKLTFAVLSFVFILIGFNLVVVSLADELVNPKIQGFFDTLTAISFYMYWFLGGILILMWIYTLWNTVIYKQNVDAARRFGTE